MNKTNDGNTSMERLLQVLADLLLLEKRLENLREKFLDTSTGKC